MIYQTEFSSHADTFHHGSGEDFNFPPHLHESFELITVTEGEMNVTVDGKVYVLTPGKAVLVFPDQMHNMETKKRSKHALWIFSPKYVQAFTKSISEKIPESNLFTPDPFYLEKLLSLKGQPNTWRIKGLLYSLCAEFDENAAYTERKKNASYLLPEIFKFIENNYSSDCSLETLSFSLGFHAVYLSRYFREHTGITFTEYVNRHRLEEACYMLKNTDETVLRIAYECGFGSLRSFNRNFKKYLSITPNEYKTK